MARSRLARKRLIRSTGISYMHVRACSSLIFRHPFPLLFSFLCLFIFIFISINLIPYWSFIFILRHFNFSLAFSAIVAELWFVDRCCIYYETNIHTGKKGIGIRISRIRIGITGIGKRITLYLNLFIHGILAL